MFSSDGRTGIPANTMNIHLRTVAKGDIQNFEEKIRFTEAYLIKFDKQGRSSKPPSFTLEKRRMMEALNNEFTALPRTPLKALANIGNDIKHYESIKNSQSLFVMIDLDRFIELYKQNLR